MRELFRLLENEIASGGDAVIVTVVASSGSTPRGAGARMLITKDGRVRGTIGGGAVEYRSEQMAKQVLAERSSKMEHFMLHKNQVQDLGMICGGDVNVYFRYIPAGGEGIIAVCRRIEALFENGEQSWLICETSGEGGIAVYGKKSGLLGMNVPKSVLEGLTAHGGSVTAEGKSYYCETLTRAGRVYIFGGGHVAQALVPVLAPLDFRCVVLEDREDFARAELFPGVEKTMLIDNSRTADFVTVTEDDWVCIMTRGHKDDRIVEEQALRTPAHYIGVIGSARKTAGVFAQMRENGFTDEDFQRITTPIGLPIKAETPAEIAVSIAAQLVLDRAERDKAGK